MAIDKGQAGYSEPVVRAAAGRAFDAFYTIARAGVKNNWKHMTGPQRINAARGLVELKHVSRRPEFSFMVTNKKSKWMRQTVEYARMRGLVNSQDEYLGTSPATLVTRAAQGALLFGLYADFYQFARSVDAYYHYICCDLPVLAAEYAEDIILHSMQMSGLARDMRARHR